jgi:hypothetical protein
MTTLEEPGHGDRTADGGSAPRLPASDAERTATVESVQDAVARGLLTHEEGAERMNAALGARFRDELPGLVVDLPPAPAVRSSPGGRRQIGTSVGAQLRRHAREVAAMSGSRRLLLLALFLVLLVVLLLSVGIGVEALFEHGGDGMPGAEWD